jgi:uncharacterized membrane protein
VAGGAGKISGTNGGRGRLIAVFDEVRASFGFPSGLAMLLGIVFGLGLPALDDALGIELPVLAFDSQSTARSLLETIATATTAVAGLSFSVTVVALTLASQQLSPRVLRSFRSDRLSQITLALFLGTFVYSLALLVRLGVSGEDAEPPNLSMTVAVLLAFAAFSTFAGFIAHIINLLQPSTVISSVHDDAVKASSERFPSGTGEPDDEGHAAGLAAGAIDQNSLRAVEARSAGYLTVVDTGPLIKAATDADAVLLQSVFVGSYVLPGETIAEIAAPVGTDPDSEQIDRFEESVHGCFVLGDQRTLVQDIAFPVRQLADIALKGLSPGINDPTTSENAIDAMGSFLIEFVNSERPSAVRVDDEGNPRLVAKAPDLDDLLRLGFEQVRISAETHPLILERMLVLLDLIEKAAARAAVDSPETGRQRRLIEEMGKV